MAVAFQDGVQPLSAWLDELAGDPRLVHVERIPPRPARHAELSRPLPPEVADRLGVHRLWVHQAAAIDLIRSGQSVAIATGTASGKSLCFQAAIAEAVHHRPGTTSLLLFPTKALAQDQLRSFTAQGHPEVVAATYDGDCTPAERTWARANANVVLTNPEMLHHGVLPNHKRWARLLANLDLVVVDELHVMRGVFGTHVAHLLRRLRRLCHHYDAHPTFVFCSATIGRPAQLASALCGLPVQEVSDDGSPRGERVVALWNPPRPTPVRDHRLSIGSDGEGEGQGDGEGDRSADAGPALHVGGEPRSASEGQGDQSTQVKGDRSADVEALLDSSDEHRSASDLPIDDSGDRPHVEPEATSDPAVDGRAGGTGLRSVQAVVEVGRGPVGSAGALIDLVRRPEPTPEAPDDDGTDDQPNQRERRPGAPPPRWSANREAAALAARLIRSGHRTLSFCRSRRGTELVAAAVRHELPQHLRDTVRSYRGGYLPEERREIEEELFDGRLRGVVATSALELGIDLGDLDAVVLCGFPGTVSSMWQQVGRSGRKGQTSVAVLVAGEDQLDQYFMDHPVDLFTRAPEPAVINPSNPYVFLPHLACASHELALTHDDEQFWPDLLDDGVRALAVDDDLVVRRRRTRGGIRPAATWNGRGWPSNRVGLRSSSSGEYRIRTANDELVGTIDEARAFDQAHPGAVYLHQGRAYRVNDLDLARRVATVEDTGGDEYTQSRSDSTIRLLEVDTTLSVGRSKLSLGSVEVTQQVTGYQRRSVATHETLERHELELPATHLVTRAFWYTIPLDVIARAGVALPRLPGALHAMEHTAIGMLPLFTICDRWDVGGVSTTWLSDTGLPTVVIHDAYTGGAGVAELGFEAADRHLAATLDVLDRCPCATGCPSCVQSPKCGNWNEPLDKSAAAALLRTILT